MLLPCRYSWAWLVLALLFSTAADADEMGLSESLVRAERYSADLSATVYQRQALEKQADTASQLPDPKLKFGIENVPLGGSNDRRFTREGMTMKRVGIMQDYISQTKRDRKADAMRDTVTDARRDVALAQARLTQLTGVTQVQRKRRWNHTVIDGMI